MQYLLLLYGDESEPTGATEVEAMRRDRAALAAELARRGQTCASHPLAGTGSATTVRRRDGRTLLCDGPFEETREQLRGVLVIEARNLDEAIAIAQRAPDASLGSVEIRPVRELP